MLQSYISKSNIILITNPKVLAVNIIDNQEPMIDLKQQNAIIYGPSPEIPNNTDYTKLRKTVYEKLKQAQAMLPESLRICLYEGYRSLQLQKMLFDNRYQKIKKLHPGWSIVIGPIIRRCRMRFMAVTKLISITMTQFDIFITVLKAGASDTCYNNI